MFSMTAFVDEIVKIGTAAEAATKAPGVLKGLMNVGRKHGKSMATLGAGATGVLGGQRLIEDVRMAEQMRDQMARRSY